MQKPAAKATAGSQSVCPECGSTDLFIDGENGEVVCRRCGLVIDGTLLDGGPEWRSYTREEEESRVRVGAPTTLTMHNKGLSTVIGHDGLDGQRRKLTVDAKNRFQRLRMRQTGSYVRGSAERNLMQAMNDLARFSDAISAPPPVREQAAAVYRKTLERGLVSGRSIRIMAAASLYIAIRMAGLPRSLSEASKICRVKRKELARCYRLIVRELGINIPRLSALSFLAGIAGEADVPSGALEAATKILREADVKRASLGKDPRGLAAAALYIASKMHGWNVTQKELARAANITEVTVRNRYRQLCRALKIQVPN